MRKYVFLLLGAMVAGCGPGGGRSDAPKPPVAKGNSAEDAPGAASARPRGVARVPEKPRANVGVTTRFESYRTKYADMTREGLWQELALGAVSDPPLGFDPAKAKYFDEVVRELQLTAEEKSRLVKTGLVSVDHGQDYSMASAYYAIYTRDLPVLVTTDSILNALHRSFDKILQHLEEGLFTDTIDRTLADAHDALGRRKPGPAMDAALHDADLYLTTARNLLKGAGAPAGDPSAAPREPGKLGLLVSSRTGIDGEVQAVLDRVTGGRLEGPLDGTSLYGGKRPIDYSQFAPRGHYTETPALRRYFRALMWLGRADTGFFLSPPNPDSGIRLDAKRERRDALLLTALLVQAKALRRLSSMGEIIDFLVGGSDNLTAHSLAAAAASRKLDLGADWTDGEVATLFDGLAAESAQQIRSQVLATPLEQGKKTAPPGLFQLFGQRFLLDSFVLSQVVHDSIEFQKTAPARLIPSGLDVMAAFGSDEAVRLLQPELDKHHYAANLLAARRVVETQPEEDRRASAYASWMDAIGSLFGALPEAPAHVPQVMRTTPWRRKTLQTGLAAWAELRHDTLLYGKQSYGASTACEYPDGFVEPYPEVYEKIGALVERIATMLDAADLSHPVPEKAAQLAQTRAFQTRFLRHFGSIARWLAGVSRKELAAQPLPAGDIAFLKKTIDIRGGGSGPPRYDGWYPSLVYGGEPAKYKPTVADVHTYPGDLAPPAVVEVGTGSVTFLVMAVDNEDDRAVYVGPASSYYEFTEPPENRLTDEAWLERLASAAPKRPGWIAGLQAPALERRFDPKPVADPLASQRSELLRTKDPKARAKLLDELRRSAFEEERKRQKGTCACPPSDPSCPC